MKNPVAQTQQDIEQIIAGMAEQLRRRFGERAIHDVLMVGIHTGGVWIAQRLHQLLGLRQPLGKLDISFYRDDFSRIGINPQVKPSEIPTTVDGSHVVLVDDILHTGRTVRAAMNEIFDYGRPASVTLVVLGERSGRELPIQADVVGQHFQLDAHEHIKLSGPQPLALDVVEAP